MGDELPQQSRIFDLFILDLIDRSWTPLSQTVRDEIWLKFSEFFDYIPLRILLGVLFRVFRYMKSSRLNESRSIGEIPGRARRKERLSRSKLKQAFLIDSDAELFRYLIQCIRFGFWKVPRLNQALHRHVNCWSLVLRVITRGTNETRVSFSDYQFKSVLFKY